MKLEKDQKVVAAWCERAAGPGWSNQLVHVLIRELDGSLRIEYLQTEEWAESTRTAHLFGIACAVHADVTSEMRGLLEPK